MAITASSVGTGDTLETFRQEFNNAVVDLGNLDGAAVEMISISGNNSTNETVYLTFADGATGSQGLETDTGLTYNPSTGLITTATLTTTGLITSGSNIVIADAGTIGSSSDTNAIGISSGGVVSITATTANTSASDGALTVAGGAGVAADLSVGDDLRLISDSAVLSFGADSDTTLTHTDGSGLTLNSTNKLMFGDTGTYIHQSADGVLDLVSDTEIEINATTIDVNGTTNFSGAITPASADGAAIGSASLEWSDLYLADASVIYFGADQDTILTHVHNTGLRLEDSRKMILGAGNDMALYHDGTNSFIENSTGALKIATETSGIAVTIGHTTSEVTVADNLTVTGNLTVNGTNTIVDTVTMNAANAIIFEGATADAHETTLTITDPTADRVITLPNTTGTVLLTTAANPASSDGAALGSASLEWSDLFLADGGQILFGDDQEITLSHNADNGLILKHVGTSDGIEPSLTFQAGDTDIAINDVLGSIFFQAPDEGSGTDAILIAAGIEAVSEGDFSSSNNATKLSFLTAASELASEKMSLSSAGNLTVSGDVSVGDDLTLASDGAVLSFGADGEIPLTHVHNTGVRLDDNDKMLFGAGSDMGLWHDGSNSYIANGTGALKIATETSGIAVTIGHSTSEVTVADNLTVTGNLTVSGTQTVVDTVTMNAANAIVFEGATADAHETTLSIVDPTGDHTQYLINQGGYIPVLAAVTTTAISATPAEINLIDGGTSRGTTAVASGDGILINDAGTMRMTNVDTVSTYFASHSVGGGNIVTTGALDSGSITSGFGAIDNGTSGIRTNTFTAETSFVPDAQDGAALGTSSLQFSDLFLADGAVVSFGDDNEITLTHVADVGLNLKHTATADDKPIILTLQTGETDMAANDVMGAIRFQAPDEGTGTDAILVAAAIQAVSEGDFSSSSNATRLEFHTGSSEAAASKMTLSSGGVLDVDGGVTIDNITIDGTEIDLSSGDLTVDVAGDIILDADGGDFKFQDGGTEILRITNSSSDVVIKPVVDAKDIIFQQRDGTEVARIEDAGQFHVSSTTASTSQTTGAFIVGGGAGIAADLYVGDDLGLISDGAVLTFGADKEIVLTHVHDSGIRFDDSDKLLFGAGSDLQIYHDGSNSYVSDQGTGLLVMLSNNFRVNNAGNSEVMINAVEDGAVSLYYDNTVQLATGNGGGTLTGTWMVTSAIIPDASDGATLGTSSYEWSDLYIADGGIVYFGDDQEITLTHVADTGLNLKHTATADDKPIILTLQTGETDIAANDVLGEIRWQAPDEGTGTDAIAIAASIVAISEGDFSSSNNATKMEFRLGSSEAATQKATLSSNGNFQVDGTLTADATATLLIKNSSGSTLKTINGFATN